MKLPGMRCSLLLLLATAVGCASEAPLPPAAVAMNDMGAQALAEGDLETAGARLELALEYNPKFVEALSNLGMVEIQRGNFKRAKQLMERAIRLNPNFAQPHHGLGVLAERQFRPDQASQHYREALRIDPGFAESRANLGRLLYHNGDYEHALVHFRKLSQIAPDFLEGYRGLAATLVSLYRDDEAVEVLVNARSTFGDAPEIRLLEGRVMVNRAEYGMAKQHLLPLASRQDEMGVEALSWMAIAELATQKPSLAAGAAEKALRLDPEHPLATYALAVALDDLGDPNARHWLQRAAKLSPNHPELLRRLSGAPPPAPAQPSGAPPASATSPTN